jgi:hypothetical protein
MKIHNVEEHYQNVHRIDPYRGEVIERVRQLRRSSVERIKHPDFGTYEVGLDGAFDVPNDVAVYFLKQPGWYEGVSPFEIKPAAAVSVAAKTARKPRQVPVAA